MSRAGVYRRGRRRATVARRRLAPGSAPGAGGPRAGRVRPVCGPEPPGCRNRRRPLARTADLTPDPPDRTGRAAGTIRDGCGRAVATRACGNRRPAACRGSAGCGTRPGGRWRGTPPLSLPAPRRDGQWSPHGAGATGVAGSGGWRRTRPAVAVVDSVDTGGAGEVRPRGGRGGRRAAGPAPARVTGGPPTGGPHRSGRSTGTADRHRTARDRTERAPKRAGHRTGRTSRRRTVTAGTDGPPAKAEDHPAGEARRATGTDAAPWSEARRATGGRRNAVGCPPLSKGTGRRTPALRRQGAGRRSCRAGRSIGSPCRRLADSFTHRYTCGRIARPGCRSAGAAAAGPANAYALAEAVFAGREAGPRQALRSCRPIGPRSRRGANPRCATLDCIVPAPSRHRPAWGNCALRAGTLTDDGPLPVEGRHPAAAQNRRARVFGHGARSGRHQLHPTPAGPQACEHQDPSCGKKPRRRPVCCFQLSSARAAGRARCDAAVRHHHHLAVTLGVPPRHRESGGDNAVALRQLRDEGHHVLPSAPRSPRRADHAELDRV